ncbi:MAG: hypothetical protein JWQ08_272 [Deinococcus sp.]|nr:hypothetical protein [Deinococcus sp.]
MDEQAVLPRLYGNHTEREGYGLRMTKEKRPGQCWGVCV